jgi:hypothetical protein
LLSRVLVRNEMQSARETSIDKERMCRNKNNVVVVKDGVDSVEGFIVAQLTNSELGRASGNTVQSALGPK